MRTSKTSIVLALVAVIVLFFMFKCNVLDSNTKDSIALTKNTIEVSASSRDIEFYTAGGDAPVVELVENGRTVKTYTVSRDAISLKKGGSETIRVGVPSGFDYVRLKAKSGSISGSADVTNAKIGTVSGSIRIDSLYGEDLQIESVSGSIRIKDTKAENFRANSVSGSITVDKYEGEEGDFESVSGSIHVGTTLKAADVSTTSVSGTMEVGIINDPSASEEIKIKTVSGSATVSSI